MDLPRLVRTLRPLRPRQIVGQVTARVRAAVEDPHRFRRQLAADGAVPIVRWRPRSTWRHPDGEPLTAVDAARGEFCFVGVKRSIGCPPRWQLPDAPKLWRYNLHYHGFLFGLDEGLARKLVASYLDATDAGELAEGWEPYPLSLRLMNWTALFFGRWRERLGEGDAFAVRLWLEIRRMASWLGDHLEVHLMANHLLENAAALTLVGTCFDDPLAHAWRQRGMALLSRELDEQLLADGGHFERSPMYQQRVLYVLLALANTGDREVAALVASPIAKMSQWLQWMTHPDGDIACFNDAALGVYPSTSKLLAWATELALAGARSDGDPWVDLRPSGYVVGRASAQGHQFVMDVGDIGPAYQPGHAHADFLAVELSLFGHRFVVDGGNYDYEPSPQRAWCRSVVGHSTVFVPDAEPLELWGAFRVGRRGHPVDVISHRLPNGGGTVAAGHTGYRHLEGAPTPRRRAMWSPSGVLRLHDWIDAGTQVVGISQLRVCGRWLVARVAADRLRFERDGRIVHVVASHPIELEACRHYPRFGVERPAHRLRVRFWAAPNGVQWTIAVEGAIEPRVDEAGDCIDLLSDQSAQ